MTSVNKKPCYNPKKDMMQLYSLVNNVRQYQSDFCGIKHIQF
jgi:hypothetical protein